VDCSDDEDCDDVDDKYLIESGDDTDDEVVMTTSSIQYVTIPISTGQLKFAPNFDRSLEV
jgi:hypothetical protein